MNKETIKFKYYLTNIFVYEDCVEIEKLGGKTLFKKENVKQVSISNFGTRIKIDVGTKKDIIIILNNKKDISNFADYLNNKITFSELKDYYSSNSVSQNMSIVQIDSKSFSFFNKKWGNLLGWLFILMGIMLSFGDILSGLLFIICGILITSFGNSLLLKIKIHFSKKTRILIVVGLLVIFAFSLGDVSTQNSNIIEQNKVVNNSVDVSDDKVQVGQEGFLKLSNVSDPDQVICIGSTEEEYKQITKALLVKDYLGILEIPGAFCVGNGTKVQVIDRGYGIRKVRIIETYRDIDSDKLLRSGWTSMEWIASK